MAAANLKDLPTIGDSLKGELLSPRTLKETTVSEKNVLPTAEDVKAEKTHKGLIDGVEGFSAEKLNHVKTREPATGADGELEVDSGQILVSWSSGRKQKFDCLLDKASSIPRSNC
jgi:hypothetical protein